MSIRIPKFAVVLFAALMICGVVTAVIQVSHPKVNYRSDARSYTSASPPTFADLVALNDSMYLNTPPPPGFTLTKADGVVTGTITGSLLGPPPEYSISVTITTIPDELDTARLYLNDLVIFKANRDNGAIVEKGGKAIATLTGFVPQSGPFTLKVIWMALNGQTREESLTF